jgi:hypothetical protein
MGVALAVRCAFVETPRAEHHPRFAGRKDIVFGIIAHYANVLGSEFNHATAVTVRLPSTNRSPAEKIIVIASFDVYHGLKEPRFFSYR